MKYAFLQIYTLFFLFYALNLSAKQQIYNWERIKCTDGIEVFRRSIKNSNIVAFKGIAEINASIEKVLFVLLDNEHRVEWVSRLKSSKILEGDNKSFEYIAYQEFKLPWPMMNRYFIYKGIVKKSGKQIILKMNSVYHDFTPKNTAIKAELHHSYYRMKSLTKNKTKLEIEIYSDPKGGLPKWFANLIQKNWPYKTLKGIRNQVKKKFINCSLLPIE